MTEPTEEYEDVYPLLGAIGPYLSFTTGHMNPVEESFAEFADEDLPQNTPENTTWPEDLDTSPEVVYPEEDDNDYWEDNEQ